MDRRRFVKNASAGTAGWLLTCASSRSQGGQSRPQPHEMGQTAWGKVWVRWTEPALPLAKALLAPDLVVPWGTGRAFVERARKQGYRVNAAVTPEQAPAAAEASRTQGFSGILLEPGKADQGSAEEVLDRLRLAYPQLTFVAPAAGGKPPAMKGSTVFTQDGMLQVSSPTEQPWIDSNFALVRFDRAFRPQRIPLIDFQWETSNPVHRQDCPCPEDYCLAVAEAGALHSDLILNLHPKLQRALARGSDRGWAVWKAVAEYLSFYLKQGERPVALEANLGVVTDSYDVSYETTNLLARHNLSFRVLPPRDLTAQGLTGLDMIVLFATPDADATREVAAFAESGGIAILIGLRGPFPWQSTGAKQADDHSVTYMTGKGRVIELPDGVDDPGVLAQDIRRLLGKEKMPLSLWNASTTLGVPYYLPGSPRATLELVNYSTEVIAVQVRIQGAYSTVRYETPERGVGEALKPTPRGDFTEFVVPWLRIGARVHMG